ncbi:hypothetical protein FT663_04847 [Candidozyma haemuli var. vulneris]|uniref:PUL domain-containing protein n=1 Tax=Candidozyma haemuli TaxID=45357 RepID=A0A2V1AVC0_9ASCO|nr:hypothetical protein CXQ85_004746 [[Candida] haemuloni]KAF3985737.1 hypothetical protein FT662_04969 [[Candida] haemuloni var. vulneris]KAF3986537.1 hypothetical protein FT663_04847 [[Candida] haemuloni var. vulneris]PVH22077.1 hypothetical protein CXQ85_004746 [[Candida] haemuloni]
MYKLRSTLPGHESDVRGIAAVSDEKVVSGSRDGTARVWDLSLRLDTNPNNEICFSSPTGAFVNAVEYVNSAFTGDVVAVGGKDAIIYLSELHGSFVKPGDDFGKFQLVGHQGNVCSLDFKDDSLISGSWDCTAKVWDLSSFSVKYNLTGHGASVWDAKIIDAAADTYLTCSADRTIRKWKGDKEIAQYSGHNDVIRKLLVLPGGKQFVSASNDCTLKVWDLESGTVLQTLHGHDSFIYDISVLSNGDLVSTAEDRSVRIWRNGKTLQAITLPCISVWCVDVLPNDDIVVGGSDKMVYVFTSSPERAATEGGIQEFSSLVQNSAISEQSIDDLKRTDIPGYEALERAGKEEGSTIMVKSPAGVIEAHQWSGGEWVKIGDVVSSAGGSSGKKTHNGKEWDYVFDVDVEDGKPPLKLPYNSNENPYTAADRFLADHELPASYKDEVVRFIEQNTGGFSLEQGSGASQPAPAAAAQEAPSTATQNFKLLPEKSPITFKDFKPEQLIKGFKKFNSEQPETKEFTPSQIRSVESALNDLKSKDALFIITDIVPKILSSWEPSQKLIGFDLLRVSIPRVTTVDLIQSTEAAEEILKMLLQSLDEVSEENLPLVMMIARVLCNLTTSTLFAQLFFTVDDHNQVTLNEYYEDFVNKTTVVIKIITSSQVASGHKHYSNALTSVAAFLYDLTALVSNNKSLSSNPSAGLAFYALLDDIAEDLINADEEAAYRVCVALGNLLVLKVTSNKPAWYDACKKLYSGARFKDIYRDIDLA